MRSGNIERITLETAVKIELDLDGQGKTSLDSGIGFFDHMLDSFCRFARFNLNLSVKGDLRVDQHHTIEDCGIALGQAFVKAIGDRKGIERVGDCLFPMDEALVQAAVDISNRGFLSWQVDVAEGMVGDFPVEMAEEFFRAFAINAGLTVHIRLLAGRNKHHVMEAVYKAFGRALGLAVRKNCFDQDVPSTKGVL